MFGNQFHRKHSPSPLSHLPQQQSAAVSGARVWDAGLYSALICQAVGFLRGPFLVLYVSGLGERDGVPVPGVSI